MTYYSALHYATKAEKSASEAALHNLKNKITNCITEIPQDIKFELADGALTLKAGSKVYVPNGKNADGSLKFDVVTIASDVVASAPYTNAPIFVYYYKDSNSISQANNSAQCSGASSSITNGYWYDTTNNFVKRISGGAEHHTGESLPLGIINASNGSWASIDQVFNGFGYIGSTVFALPNVKGLIPNGRNADGSLKNAEFTVDKVLTVTGSYPSDCKIMLRSDSLGTYINLYYDDANNINVDSANPKVNSCIAGTMTRGSGGVITSFQPKLPFRAIDYQEAALKQNFQVVSTLPSSPQPDVFYFIPE